MWSINLASGVFTPAATEVEEKGPGTGRGEMKEGKCDAYNINCETWITEKRKNKLRGVSIEIEKKI